MRILMVNTAYSRGGAAAIARSLHLALNASDNHESLFAYGRGQVTEAPETVRFTVQMELCLHGFLTRLSGTQGYGTWTSTRRLLRVIRDWKPDVIHFHNIHGYYLDIGIAKAVGELGIPVVWTLHDAWPLTGRCAYALECRRWRTGCGHCPDLRSYPRTCFDSSAVAWRKKRELLGGFWKPVIVTPSRWLADLVLEASADQCRVEVIPNGIDTGLFRLQNREQARSRLGLHEDKKVVLFAAADLRDERKGARYFFESLNYVQAGGWEVVTVGKTVELPRVLRERAGIRQLGYLGGRESVAEVYSAADLFCITALDDNFPTTVLESMSCGTPVVGFSVGGIPEQVAEGCGQLVGCRDVKAFAEAITVLLKDDALRRMMSMRCRERAVREYSLERFVERYLAIYREVGGGGGER